MNSGAEPILIQRGPSSRLQGDAFPSPHSGPLALWSCKALVWTLSSPSLSQYSDENMMDAGNLAIVFGPTLLPTPEALDQVACQAHVNEVVKTVILNHDNIFPDTKELPGPVYEKCMTGDQYWSEPLRILSSPNMQIMLLLPLLMKLCRQRLKLLLQE